MPALIILMIVTTVGIIILGYFIVSHLDKYLNENKKRTEKEKKEASCVTLTTNMTDEELIEHIRKYEKHCKNAYITLYQNKEELSSELFDKK